MPSGSKMRFAQERLQRLAGDARDQHPEDVGAAVIHPPFARLVDERQAPEAFHQLVRRMRRQVRARRDACFRHRGLDRVARGIGHHGADPEPKGQEIAQRDRTLGRHGIVQRAVDGAQHLAVRQFGEPAVDRLIEPQLGLLDQDHGGDGGDRLGHRSDPEDGVAPHRILPACRFHADGIDVRLAAPADQRD